MRVVLDTNVLLQMLPRRSRFRPIFDALVTGQLQLVVSTSILLEYAEILEQKTSAPVSANVLGLLSNLPGTHFLEVYYRFRLPYADPDDQKFVDAYVAGNAEYLVSNDRHLTGLGGAGFPAVRVVAAEAFLELLPQQLLR